MGGILVLSGTTGLSEAEMERIRKAGAHAPVLWTSHTSLGVLSLHVLAGRQGDVGPCSDSEMSVLAVHGGEVACEHTLMLLGGHDRLEITHRAAWRRLFAEGALALARRFVGRDPGFCEVRGVFRGTTP